MVDEVLDDAERRPRIVLAERPHEGHGQVSRERGRQSDHDPAHRRALAFVDVAARPVHLRQDAAGMLEQPLACVRRRGAAAVAQQQHLAQLDLEPAHLPADRGLRDAKNAGGAGKPAQVDDVDEILELLQIHTKATALGAHVDNPCRIGITASVPAGFSTYADWRTLSPLVGARSTARSFPFKPPSPACSCGAARHAARSSTPTTCPPTSPRAIACCSLRSVRRTSARSTDWAARIR